MRHNDVTLGTWLRAALVAALMLYALTREIQGEPESGYYWRACATDWECEQSERMDAGTFCPADDDECEPDEEPTTEART